jgi:ElaB/YqjD/DUF883 family membrane-anchored ribosome-binding protein
VPHGLAQQRWRRRSAGGGTDFANARRTAGEIPAKGTTMLENTTASGAALADELRNVVSQAEELLRAMGDDGDAAMAALRERVHASIDTARLRLEDLEHEAGRMTQQATAAAETYVRENPWTAVAIGAGLGLLLGGLLVGRRRPTVQ